MIQAVYLVPGGLRDACAPKVAMPRNCGLKEAERDDSRGRPLVEHLFEDRAAANVVSVANGEAQKGLIP